MDTEDINNYVLADFKIPPGRAHTIEKKMDIFGQLFILWHEQYPHLRLGQLISHIVGKDDLFSIEDDTFLSRIEETTKEKLLTLLDIYFGEEFGK